MPFATPRDTGLPTNHYRVCLAAPVTSAARLRRECCLQMAANVVSRSVVAADGGRAASHTGGCRLRPLGGCVCSLSGLCGLSLLQNSTQLAIHGNSASV